MLVNTGLRQSMLSSRSCKNSSTSTVPWAPSLRMYANLPKSRTINGHQPVFKLPVEVLCDIFLITLKDDRRMSLSEKNQRRGLFVSMNCFFDPVVLTRICSYWRIIALDFPALWNRIYLPSLSPYLIRPLKTWLLRSKGSPLRIQVDCPVSLKPNWPSSHYILSLIFAYSSCWRSIEFDVGFWSVEPMVHLVRSSEPCKVLESAIYCISELPIQPCPEYLKQPIREVASFFHASPALRKESWFNDVIAIPAPSLPQLRSLEIWFPIHAENLLKVLAELPNIQYLHVRRWELPSPATNSLLHSVVLPQLRELIIRVDHPMNSFFNNVTLPSLRILEIIYQGFDRPYHPSLFQDFFRRSGCFLHRLKLCGKGPEDCVEEILTAPALQNLTDLYLKWSWISDRVMRLLVRDSSHALMPNLQSLILGKCRVSDGLVSALVSTRWYMPLGNMGTSGRLRKALISCTPRGPLDSTFLEHHADNRNLACIQYDM